MKTFKLVSMAMLCMAVVLVSCSGEDGETGAQGAKGDPGESIKGDPGENGNDGISCWDLNGNGVKDANEDINQDGNFDGLDCQGDNGENGMDGNANVQELLYGLELFGNYTDLTINLNDFEEIDTPANYAYLYYLHHTNGNRYSIPGHLVDNTHYARVHTNLQTGNLFVNFYDLDNSPFVVPGSEYQFLVIVAIELSNAGKTSENVMAELKAAGVDTSDYDAVATYFGLK
ncbi:MAG: collagen-like protein [Algicola sp.]|nr:collagen-like protein [Algicola sp.]